jgi:DNA-binding IclR family transcriptional regulator
MQRLPEEVAMESSDPRPHASLIDDPTLTPADVIDSASIDVPTPRASADARSDSVMAPVQIIARPADPPVHAGQTIAAVERALDVLLLFGSLGRGDLGVTEISSELGMSKAAVHRVLSSLRSRGLVVLDAATHRYSLGAAALALGRAYLEQLEVRRLALPEMARLADAVDETVLLSVRVNDLQMFVEEVLPQREVRIAVPVGTPIPLHIGSAGKVFLAHFTDDDVEDYINRTGLEPLTEDSITDSDELRADVIRVRERGYGSSLGEREPGGASIAAPILDDQGRPAAVLVIAGPADRVAPMLDELARPLLAITSTLSRRLGFIQFDLLD